MFLVNSAANGFFSCKKISKMRRAVNVYQNCPWISFERSDRGTDCSLLFFGSCLFTDVMANFLLVVGQL